jgi:hypothetical protein
VGNKIDMLGEKYGKLTVKEISDYRGKNNRDIYYICDCDCGNKNIQVMGTSLRRKNKPTLNCKECGDKKKVKHGMKGTRLYKIWDSMKQRCFNANNEYYYRYGGRGITISDEWLGKCGFNNFMEWSYANGYNENLTIDRKDNDGNYEPSNCRWVSMKIQANNKSINKLIEYKGITKTLSQWAEEFDIPYVTFVKRIDSGWDIERALKEEVTQKRKKIININGKNYTYEELSKITGYAYKTLFKKLNQGVTYENLLEMRKI